MTEDQRKSFEEAALPLIKWLCENGHPHHTAIVTQTHAELLESLCSTGEITDFLSDQPAICCGSYGRY